MTSEPVSFAATEHLQNCGKNAWHYECEAGRYEKKGKQPVPTPHVHSTEEGADCDWHGKSEQEGHAKCCYCPSTAEVVLDPEISRDQLGKSVQEKQRYRDELHENQYRGGAMTVSTTSTGNGSTTLFPFTFLIFAKVDLKVILRVDATGVETVQTLATNYTVSAATNPNDALPWPNV